MMLCLDCGNTRLKWGLRDGEQWRATGALSYDEIDGFGVPVPSLQGVIGCNVAGKARAQRIEALLQRPVTWITSVASQCGVTSGYEQPSLLGPDRWAALIGARALHAGASLVVVSGTATTIDVLGADGHHRGGIILPGLVMMANALSNGTAALPEVEVGTCNALPRNTHAAIASGALMATVGTIRTMFAHVAHDAQARCLVSGGAAGLLLPLLDMPHRHVEHLVLEGLVAIAATHS